MAMVLPDWDSAAILMLLVAADLAAALSAYYYMLPRDEQSQAEPRNAKQSNAEATQIKQ